MPSRNREKPIHLDGTHLEGGGQLVRFATCLSALTGHPLRITDIRGRRRGDGGLKLQHLKAVTWLAEACGAEVRGAEKGSREMVFLPEKKLPRGGGRPALKTEIDITTPGAVTLVVQAVLPYLLFGGAIHQNGLKDGEESEPITLVIRGGTNVSNSPSVDHLHRVLIPMLNKACGTERVSLEVKKRCWANGHAYGGIGQVDLTVRPLKTGASLQAFDLEERGSFSKISAYVLAPKGTHERIRQELEREAASSLFTKFMPIIEDAESVIEGKKQAPELDIHLEETTGSANNLSVLLVAHFDQLSSSSTSLPVLLASDNLYLGPKPKNPAFSAAYLVRQAATNLSKEIATGACIDTYMRDQLVVYQSLSAGACSINPGTAIRSGNFEGESQSAAEAGERRPGSLHAKTAWWVAERMVGAKFGDEGVGPGVEFVAGQGQKAEFEPIADEHEVDVAEEEWPEEPKKSGKTKASKAGTGSGRAKFGKGPGSSKLLADAMADMYL
jgi:RNA 3'-terminal phosphate cyclase (ATP)